MRELEGFIEDMPFEEYAKIPALNGSSIVHMRRSPLKYHYERNNPTPPSSAMHLGTLTHQLILEPSTMEKIAVWGLLPEQKIRRGYVWDAFREANEGKIIMTVGERDEMEGMANAALNSVPVRNYAAAKGATEVSMFWRHPHTKRRYKARIDKIITDPPTLVDLKTCRDSRPYKFGPQAHALGYVVKMANYWNGYRILTGVEPAVKLLAVESKAPHESVAYNIPRDLLLLGLEELDALVARLDECEKSWAWPAAEPDEIDLELPPWASAEADTELDLDAGGL